MRLDRAEVLRSELDDGFRIVDTGDDVHIEAACDELPAWIPFASAIDNDTFFAVRDCLEDALPDDVRVVFDYSVESFVVERYVESED